MSGEDIKLPAQRARLSRRRAILLRRRAKSWKARSSACTLGIDTVVLRLGRVPFMDATGLHTLTEIIQRYQRHRVRVILCGIHDELRGTLDAAGIPQLVGEANICDNMQMVAERINKSSV